MISIIMPVWNGSKFIDRSIASVVAQTRSEWELIIVDDGSTDDSLERTGHWRDMVNSHLGEEKIRVYTTGKSNSGPQVGMNLAAEKARYRFLAYLDMDDLFFPRRVESLLPFVEKYDLIFAPYEIHQAERLSLWNVQALWERQSYVASSEGDREPPFDTWARAGLEQMNFSIPLGAATRREIFEAVGGFQPDIVLGAEGVLWRRMANQGARIGFCPVVAGRYYVRRDSQARTKKPFSTGSFEILKDHPLGPNGQYLDAEWFASLARRKDPERDT